MKRFLAPAFLVILAATLSACSNGSRIVATGLEGKLTRIVRASDGSVTASWHVSNPNVVAYLFARVSSKIFLNGTYVGVIVDENPLGLPASSEADRAGKITGGDAAAARVLAEAVALGSANYRVETQITLRIYDDVVEKSMLLNSGTVPVTAQ